MTKSEELREMAIQLRAIGQYQMDTVSSQTVTGALLVAAAKALENASRNMCAQGYYGCRGGDTCTSDHK